MQFSVFFFVLLLLLVATAKKNILKGQDIVGLAKQKIRLVGTDIARCTVAR